MNTDITPEMEDITNYYDRFNEKITSKVNPFFIIIGVSIIILFSMLFGYLGRGEPVEVGTPGKGSVGAAIIKIIGSAVLVFLLLVNGLQYFFKIIVVFKWIMKLSIRHCSGVKPHIY